MKGSRIVAGLWLATAACAAPGHASGDALTWATRYMVVNGTDDSTLAPALIEVVENASLRTPEMRDLLAEVVVRIQAGRLPAKEAGMHILRVLAAAPDAGRYFDVIAQVRGYLDNKATRQVLAGYDRKFRKPADTQYVPGSIDLDALRRRYADDAFAAQPTAAQARVLASLPPDATMDAVFSAAGTPALALPRDLRLLDTYARVQVRQIGFYYRGVGRVVFEYKHGAGWRRHDVLIDPLVYEPLMPYRSSAAERGLPDDATLAMLQLLSGHAASIRASAMATRRLESASPEYLDTAAELLLRKHAGARTTAEIDAYGWLCNVLVHHGGMRYADVLETVAEGTRDPKLTRYAEQPITKGRGQPRNRYVPGSVDLAAQARKYPTPYPGIDTALAQPR